jgi:hypothetical protein
MGTAAARDPPVRAALLALLLLVSTVARAETPDPRAARWSRLPAQARETIALRRAVRDLGRGGTLRTAHPEVARRLSDDLSKSLGREVRVPSRRIVQVVWGSAEHRALRKLLGSTVGIGIYPSKTWGHSKLRLGDLVSDAVPGGATPFPSTGTRARLVPMEGMHGRYYEAVFAADPAALQSTLVKAEGLVASKRDSGMGCASFVSKLLREHLADATRQASSTASRLAAFGTSESAAGPLWKKAAGSSPALIIVYTPPGDYRSVTHPDFKFDYALR